jgi:hypothetical protein
MIFYVTHFQRNKIRFYSMILVYFAKTLKTLPPVYFTGLAVYFLCFEITLSETNRIFSGPRYVCVCVCVCDYFVMRRLMHTKKNI